MRAARRKNLFGFARSRVTYHRDVASERRQLQREAMEERRRQVQLKKLRAQEIAAEAKIRAAERKISAAEQKIEVAARKASSGASRAAGGLSESEFERIKAHMEAEIAKQEDVKKRAEARVAGNPSWGFGIYRGRGFATEQLAHFKSREAAETYARTRGLTGYSIKRAFDKSTNPAVSPEQYRLAQAVLSGTARKPGMTVEVAREIVDRTPAHLRGEYTRRNPGRQLYLDGNTTLYEQPPDAAGMMTGPTRYVTRGTPIEILQRGRGGHRFLVKADYYGTPYYGWVDKDRTTREALNPAGPHNCADFPTFEPDQSSPEYQLGYNLGQRDKETASLHRTAGELEATFLVKFDAERASLQTFTKAYAAGISSGSAASNNPVPHDAMVRFVLVWKQDGRGQFEEYGGYYDKRVAEEAAGRLRDRGHAAKVITAAERKPSPAANPHDLYDRIQDHLASGGVVAVRTSLKHTNYLPKHAKMFRRGKAEEDGVYVQRGKHWDYVFPEYIHFGRYKSSNPSVDDQQPRQAGREAARRVIGEGLSVKAIGPPMIAKYFNIWWKHEAPHYAGGLADMPPKAASLAAFKQGWRSALNNPEPAGDGSDDYAKAKRIAELFHGRPVKEEITVTESLREHDWLAEIGPLVELRIKAFKGYPFRTARFRFGLTEDRLIHLQTSPDGRQMYLRGGDQELDLDALGMGERTEWYRDLMSLGEVTYFAYRDQKKFHGFKMTEYTHKIGSALDASGSRHVQKTNIKPVMLYDTLSKKIQLAGGQGKVETENLVEEMSPGIVN